MRLELRVVYLGVARRYDQNALSPLRNDSVLAMRAGSHPSASAASATVALETGNSRIRSSAPNAFKYARTVRLPCFISFFHDLSLLRRTASSKAPIACPAHRRCVPAERASEAATRHSVRSAGMAAAARMLKKMSANPYTSRSKPSGTMRRTAPAQRLSATPARTVQARSGAAQTARRNADRPSDPKSVSPLLAKLTFERGARGVIGTDFRAVAKAVSRLTHAVMHLVVFRSAEPLVVAPYLVINRPAVHCIGQRIHVARLSRIAKGAAPPAKREMSSAVSTACQGVFGALPST